MCATALDVNDLLMYPLGGVVLRALDVHNVLFRTLSKGLNERAVKCFSSFVSFEAAWYQPSFFGGCLVLRKPDMVELFRIACFEDLLRDGIRLNRSS